MLHVLFYLTVGVTFELEHHPLEFLQRVECNQKTVCTASSAISKSPART
jgi:hypothetical protein